MTDSPTGLLQTWLRRQLPNDQFGWLEGQVGRVRDGGDRDLHIALGMVPRRLGKADLALSDADLADASAARPGWDPRGWSVDQTARILLVLAGAGRGNDFAPRFRELCRTADPAEAVAFYRGLPLYPAPELLEAQAAEGLRTNMRAVFEAVAHRNPYPRERFDQNRWNHMVLKALFVGSSLAPIQGLDERANPELAVILRDYAHERWAAGRPVSPELWRCLGPFAAELGLDDLRRVTAEGDAAERRAAALALAACPGAEAAALLSTMPELAVGIASGTLTWDSLNPGP
jgi:hypothetical protein